MVWPLLQSKLRIYAKNLKKKLRADKGSFKDPFLYCGLFSVVLFGIISLGAGSIINSFLLEKGFYFSAFASEISNTSFDQFLFAPIDGKRPATLESPELNIIQGNSLLASVPPTMVTSQVLGVILGDNPEPEIRKEIIEYIIQPGDTLSLIAQNHNISLETLLWANDLSKNSNIKTGQKLIIPPISGVIHYVQSGDTISEIARTYKGKIEEIVTFNELLNENDIYIGDILIVPGGTMPAKAQPVPANIPLVDSQFIPPVSSPYIITQGLHWYNAIDFSHSGNSCGKLVFAVAGGKVQKTGYHRISGNYVRILHPNGIVTFYGHLSFITAKNNSQVNVGEIIGYIGNTGYTLGRTGCHLHFEVRGTRNPFAK